jgi:transposase InsO family protein
VTCPHKGYQLNLHRGRESMGNRYIESFNGKLRDELLNREVFYTFAEAEMLIEQWRKEYNEPRQHSLLGNQPPASEVVIPVTLTQRVVQCLKKANPKSRFRHFSK